jgi:lysophospholipase L1-like esterase
MSKSNIDSFVALGDSFTEGLWDFRPDGTLRGWADLVAEQLAVNVRDFRYANLAVRGRKLDEVADDQVPQLERLKPSLVALGAGANDIIRTKVSPPELGNRFRRLLSQVSDVSDQVVVFAGFDPRRRIPMTGGTAERAHAYNECIRRSALQYSAAIVDLWDLPRLYEDRMWAPDRLHLSSDGHALVAAAFLTAIGRPTAFEDLAEDPHATHSPRGWLASRAEDARWLIQDVTPWAYRGLRGRSSGDGQVAKLPEYVRL